MEKWVKVESDSELRAGMALKTVRCSNHIGRDCHLLVMREVAHVSDMHVTRGIEEPCHSSRAFVTTHTGRGFWCSCFCISISEGRLFRLELGKEDGQETERTKELELTK